MPVNIKPGGKLHEYLLKQVLQRKKFSEKKMKDYHKQWSDADDSMKAYIHERDVDKKRKDKKTFDGEVDYVTLEVPYTYAIVMTAHTYFSSVMLSRVPLWQFTGRHGEAQDSVMAVESVIDYQSKVGGHLPPMYNWLYDLARYSFGVIGCYWDEEEKVVTKTEMIPPSILGVPFGAPRPVQTTEIIRGFAGNKLYNVRPYDFFPDPRVPLWKFQEGEFCGRTTNEGYHNLLNTAQIDPLRYQNLDKLQEVLDSSQNNSAEAGSSRVTLPVQPGEDLSAPGVGYCAITEMYIKLIPSLWGLGDSKRLEVWCFEVAQEKVVISARPLGLIHGRFPFAVLEGNFGSEEFAKFGMLEIIRPLTDVLTWLINSHFYNVRRVLNNQLVVDPSGLVMKDVTKPGQRVIRLKPSAYGQDVRKYLFQLQQTDITRQHLTDVSMVENMIQRVSSVVDNVMGVPQRGGRKTATEVRDATGWSVSRLKTPVEYNSALGFDPLAQMMISNTQQLLDMERKYAIAGNTLDNAQAFLDINPQKIAGSFDFVPVDGTMPIDRLAQANFWKELLMQMARVPELMMQWDINGMIAHTMKMQGERNVDRFRVNMQDPAQIQKQVQLGNLVALTGGKGGRGKPPGAAGGATGTSGGTA